jgi:hypothetical protein
MTTEPRPNLAAIDAVAAKYGIAIEDMRIEWITKGPTERHYRWQITWGDGGEDEYDIVGQNEIATNVSPGSDWHDAMVL